MKLPDYKDLTRVSFWYGDKEYFVEGDQLQNYLDNLAVSAVMINTHDFGYKPVDWSTDSLEEP